MAESTDQGKRNMDLAIFMPGDSLNRTIQNLGDILLGKAETDSTILYKHPITHFVHIKIIEQNETFFKKRFNPKANKGQETLLLFFFNVKDFFSAE